jgi:hypothetical protein
MSTDGRGRHNDALVLKEILREFEQAVVSYYTVLAEVRAHQNQMAKDHAALVALRSRLVAMREPVKGWSKCFWDMNWRGGVTREARISAEREIQALDSLLDDLIWKLWDFRVKPEVGQS